jgi:hypothetical protein
MAGVDPNLLENVLRAAGYPRAADALRREVEGGQEPEDDVHAKVASLEGRLAENEARTRTADDQARAEGERYLEHLRTNRIGPWSWHEPGSPDGAA